MPADGRAVPHHGDPRVRRQGVSWARLVGRCPGPYPDVLGGEYPGPPYWAYWNDGGLQGVFRRARQHNPPLATLEAADGIVTWRSQGPTPPH